jgi:hypothetical protein
MVGRTGASGNSRRAPSEVISRTEHFQTNEPPLGIRAASLKEVAPLVFDGQFYFFKFRLRARRSLEAFKFKWVEHLSSKCERLTHCFFLKDYCAFPDQMSFVPPFSWRLLFLAVRNRHRTDQNEIAIFVFSIAAKDFSFLIAYSWIERIVAFCGLPGKHEPLHEAERYCCVAPRETRAIGTELVPPALKKVR